MNWETLVVMFLFGAWSVGMVLVGIVIAKPKKKPLRRESGFEHRPGAEPEQPEKKQRRGEWKIENHLPDPMTKGKQEARGRWIG